MAYTTQIINSDNTSNTIYQSGDILTANEFNTILERIRRLESDYIKPGLVKCEHCSQWAAMYTECHKCGAPVGGENPDIQIKGRTSQTVDIVESEPYFVDGGVSLDSTE